MFKASDRELESGLRKIRCHDKEPDRHFASVRKHDDLEARFEQLNPSGPHRRSSVLAPQIIGGPCSQFSRNWRTRQDSNL